MISIIIASSNEPNSIGKAINAVSKPEYSGYPGEFELIQVSPDDATLSAGQAAADERNLDQKYIQLQDPKEGKAHALNMALEIAQGDYIVMTDGDVAFCNNALKELLKPFENKSIGGVSGRPISENVKLSFWGYISHLLTDAADAKRKETFEMKASSYYTKKGAYFPMSGYILAFRNIGLRYDGNYIDDTLISLKVINNGYELAYAPEAKVSVKFPTTLKDYLLQRRRNFKGNREIHEDERFDDHSDPRSFVNELKFIIFPLKYAESPKQLLWSLCLYPIRLLTWGISLLPQKKKSSKSWVRISSTK